MTSTDWTTFNNKQGTTLNSARIWVGNASNTATAVDLSGDVTVNNSGAVTITPNAVTTAKISDANVTNPKIADNAVTTSKITDLNVTNIKIANGAVDSSKIASGSIRNLHIAANAIDTSKIKSGGVNKV